MTAVLTPIEARSALGMTARQLQRAVAAERLRPVARPRSGSLLFDAGDVARLAASRAERERRTTDPGRMFSSRYAGELAEHGYVKGCVKGGCRFEDRFPVEPLLALCPQPLVRLSKLMDTDVANIHRALREGVTWMQADRWAVARGFHPSEVWGDAWWEAVPSD